LQLNSCHHSAYVTSSLTRGDGFVSQEQAWPLSSVRIAAYSM
jgi:hypothetical protein